MLWQRKGQLTLKFNYKINVYLVCMNVLQMGHVYHWRDLMTASVILALKGMAGYVLVSPSCFPCTRNLCCRPSCFDNDKMTHGQWHLWSSSHTCTILSRDFTHTVFSHKITGDYLLIYLLKQIVWRKVGKERRRLFQGEGGVGRRNSSNYRRVLSPHDPKL